MSRRLAWCALVAPAAAALAYSIACGDPSHPYGAKRFDATRDCLSPGASIDVVEGDPPAKPCAVACLSDPLGDGGRLVYVSSQCPPYPFPFDASGGDPLCPAALDSYGRNDICLDDGGSTNPLVRADAADGGP